MKPKGFPGSDDSEHQEDASTAGSPKKSTIPRTRRTRLVSDDAGVETKGENEIGEASTPRKRRREGSSEELGSSPSKAAVLEAETILAQYSPGTKRNVKMADLRKLQATHAIRKEEALLKAEKQKELVEKRRQETFSRLTELGYSKALIERDGFDQLKARTRWWQLVEEPQELTEQEWDKIRHDLRVILDRRKDAMRSMRARTGGGSSAGSSPLRPKTSPVRPSNAGHSTRQDVLGEGNGDDVATSGKQTLLDELDERPASFEDDPKIIPKLMLGNATTTRRAESSSPG